MESSIKPKISVVIPFKNAEQFLRESIESVIQQKCNFQFEVIVVDDNSNDGSLKIANTFAGPNVVICKSDGIGISDALNLGIRESRSNLIARHDADDVMIEGRLQSQFEFMEENTDHVALGGQISYIGEVSENLVPNKYPLTAKELESWLARGCFLAHPTVIFRRDAFFEVGGYKKANDGAEDYDLWLRLSTVGKIANLEKVLTLYRKHDNQVTNKKWMRTHLRTAKVRLFWILNLNITGSSRTRNLNSMYISKKEILKYLFLEIYRFVVTQIWRVTKK